jgi:hypothetical protein
VPTLLEDSLVVGIITRYCLESRGDEVDIGGWLTIQTIGKIAIMNLIATTLLLS